MKKDIEKAIKETLVIENKSSIKYAVEKIMDIIKPPLFCQPPNILHCKLEINNDYDCNKCKWKNK